MNSLLTVVSSLVWWVLYGSIGALACALIAWCVLRWTERCNVVFNRVYLACLVWTLLGMLLVAGVAAHEGIVRRRSGRCSLPACCAGRWWSTCWSAWRCCGG